MENYNFKIITEFEKIQLSLLNRVKMWQHTIHGQLYAGHTIYIPKSVLSKVNSSEKRRCTIRSTYQTAWFTGNGFKKITALCLQHLGLGIRSNFKRLPIETTLQLFFHSLFDLSFTQFLLRSLFLSFFSLSLCHSFFRSTHRHDFKHITFQCI